MSEHDWVKEFPCTVWVCDRNGVMLEMNDHAADTQEGGRSLIGTNILDCHPEPARTKLVEMLSSGQANIYTIERAGKRKLIYQAPWYENGGLCRIRGIVASLACRDAALHSERVAGDPETW